MTEKEKPTPKAQAEQLLKSLLKGKQVHEIFAENMKKQLPISGMEMGAWEKKFRISVPADNLTPSMCKALSMKLMDLNQEATFYHAVSVAKAQMIKRGSDASFMSKFAALIQCYTEEGKKLPAAATLERMAALDNEELESALAIADIETKFWKDILEHLATCRKLIENASLNISVELKALQADINLDKLNKNGGFNGQ